tara:strand:+ start:209 stop:463 length:255 start_codon:yes stop_codon:yes gene_type:complete
MYNIRRKAKVEMRKYSREKLNYMHDEELSRSYSTLREAIENMRNRNKNASIPETEMCYIQRELESRKNRKIAHRAYLANKTRRF